MKATGIVRRIDDLGRVVIPKEIRRTMRIREGDPLEIYTDKDGEVIFKKYSPVGELTQFSMQYAEALNRVSGYPAAVTDTDTVVAVSGVPKKELMEKIISKDLEDILEDRMTFAYMVEDNNPLYFLENSEKYFCNIVCPIIAEGDAIGSIVLFSVEEPIQLGEIEEKVTQTSASVLGKVLEQ